MFETPDASVSAVATADLPNKALDVAIRLGLKALPNLPPMSVIYHGPPQAVARREDAGELAAFFGFKVLNQSVDQLEKLQAEQARLAKEEELQRQEDARKLLLYTAQRSELRLRLRESRVWNETQQSAQAAEQRRLEQLAVAARTLNAAELKRRQRELSIFDGAFAGD